MKNYVVSLAILFSTYSIISCMEVPPLNDSDNFYIVLSQKDAKTVYSAYLAQAEYESDEQLIDRLIKEDKNDRRSNHIESPFGEVYVPRFNSLKIKKLVESFSIQIPFWSRYRVFAEQDDYLIKVSTDNWWRRSYIGNVLNTYQDYESIRHLARSASLQKICALRKIIGVDTECLLAVHVIDLKTREKDQLAIDALPKEQLFVDKNDQKSINELTQKGYSCVDEEAGKLLFENTFDCVAIASHGNYVAIANNHELYIAKKKSTGVNFIHVWSAFELLKKWELTGNHIRNGFVSQPDCINSIDFNKQGNSIGVVFANRSGECIQIKD